eukprot:TRINITY_DN14296_c0_g1_i1.p1 TRINITY_DN14296_c0_g1~~TRINITY_DN14296_c0_g1_i1.p1  ORF type:complete len:277 (-),score=19.30 TRINITY_DN14296_c0_g1_i1:47-877(-)
MQGGSHLGGAEAAADVAGPTANRAVPHGSDPRTVQAKDGWLQDAPKDPQGANLSNLAVASTIPKAGSEETWHYPSPQRFYNAMRRKGWEPEAKDVPYVVSIHNTINEKCWAGVMEYEQFHEKECPTPKLLRFRGRPQDFSPKARLRHFFGYALPFDRHDWIIDRCGKEVKYVLDYYQGSPDPTKPASVFLDIRPEFSFGGVIDRLKMQYRRTFHGEKQSEQGIQMPAGYDPSRHSKHHGSSGASQSSGYDHTKHHHNYHGKNPHITPSEEPPRKDI